MASAEQAGRTDSTIALLVQLALAREQNGDTPAALGALERAVTLAEPAGYVRVFLQEGDAMVSLLQRLLRCQASPVATARVLQAMQPAAASLGREIPVC